MKNVGSAFYAKIMGDDIVQFKFKNPYWPLSFKISFLQRQVIICSIVYYHLDDTLISDKDYDEMSGQLLNLMSEATQDDMKATDYYYCMADYEGSTGFDLYDRLTQYDKEYLLNLAHHALRNRSRK